MNKQRNKLEITRPIVVFCVAILALLVLMSCSKEGDKKATLNVNKSSIVDKTFTDGGSRKKNVDTYNKQEEKIEKIEPIKQEQMEKVNINKYINSGNSYEDNMKSQYYGKYNLDGEEVLGNFEVTRNSIVFTPDNGHSKEVIHFSGIKNIDRFEHPNGKVDLTIEYGGEDRVIRNVSDEMFSDILLYTTK